MGKIINLNTYYYNKTEIDALLENKASVQSIQDLNTNITNEITDVWETLSPLPDTKEDKTNKISSWSSTPDAEKYPNEPLVKTYIDNGFDNLSNGLNSGLNGLSNYLDQNVNTIWKTLGPLPDGKEDKINKIQSWSSTPDSDKYPNEPLVKSELNNLGNSLSSSLTDIWNTLGPLPGAKEDKSNKIDSWSSTPSSNKYPNEYLVKSELDNKVNKTDLNGASIVFPYPIERFNIGFGDTVRSAIDKITGEVYTQRAIDEMLSTKADKTNGASQITDTNAPNYTNIGSLTNKTTQQAINQAINTKLGNINIDVSTLKSIKAIEVVAAKPTASASTMNKLYIVSENNKVNVYYTSQNGSTYSWHKMDTDILDELSIAWNDITGKPTIDTTVTNNANNLVTSQAVYNGLSSKAPTNHASTETRYGVGTVSNYGHVKVVQNLNTNDDNGLALGAGQGKILKELIDQDVTFGNHIELMIPQTVLDDWTHNGMIKAAENYGYPDINEFMGNMLAESGVHEGEIVSFVSPYNGHTFVVLCYLDDHTNYLGSILCNPEIQYKEATITYDDNTTGTVYLMTDYIIGD